MAMCGSIQNLNMIHSSSVRSTYRSHASEQKGKSVSKTHRRRFPRIKIRLVSRLQLVAKLRETSIIRLFFGIAARKQKHGTGLGAKAEYPVGLPSVAYKGSYYDEAIADCIKFIKQTTAVQDKTFLR
ncbi:hypothetical protein O6H91_06G012600 [Diphasiastrum complanatum]|uniref:Uncharacterized protein n=1 Tax=Diphasiastrum complanatum TaxID=34168 RepID=A0ACC2DAX7_DIPCM|nr:hypothetical protein O6H91_06G012600 [Diphasiastrum complanatum]